LLKQQTLITIYCLPAKENKPLLSISVCSKQKEEFAISVLRLQQKNVSQATLDGTYPAAICMLLSHWATSRWSRQKRWNLQRS
jgi:hypothetical protein